MEAGFTEAVFVGCVAIFVESNMAIGTIAKGIVLLIMRAQASSTACFKNSFRIFPRFFPLLFLHILFKLLFVSD